MGRLTDMLDALALIWYPYELAQQRVAELNMQRARREMTKDEEPFPRGARIKAALDEFHGEKAESKSEISNMINQKFDELHRQYVHSQHRIESLLEELRLAMNQRDECQKKRDALNLEIDAIRVNEIKAKHVDNMARSSGGYTTEKEAATAKEREALP